DQRSEIRRATGRIEVAAAVQLLCKCNEVDGLLAFTERDHLREDAAMLIEKEILGTKRFDGGIESVIVEKNGAENGAFSVEIVRKGLFENGFWHQSLCVSLFIRYK